MKDLNKLNNLNNNEKERGKDMKNIKNIKDIKEQIKAVKYGYYFEESIEELRKIAAEYDIYVDKFDNFVDDEYITEYIRYCIEERGWDIVDIATLMNRVDFLKDTLYIFDCGYIKNVKERDFEELKEQMIEELEKVEDLDALDLF